MKPIVSISATPFYQRTIAPPKFAAATLPTASPSSLVPSDMIPRLDDVLNRTQYLAKTDTRGNVIEVSTTDTESGWKQLPRALQAHLVAFLAPPRQGHMEPALILEKAIASKRMGILEEAADVWHEVLVLSALQNNILPEEQFDTVLGAMGVSKRKRHVDNVRLAMEAAYAHIKDEDVDRFVEAAALPAKRFKLPGGQNELHDATVLTREKARELLALNTLRFATLRLEGKGKNAILDTRTQLIGELRELKEKLPADRTSLKLKLDDLEAAAKSGPMQSKIPMARKALTDILAELVGTADTRDVMHAFLKRKQYLRQALRLQYLDKPQMTYNMRKAILKPFETLIEAYMLKRCSSGFRVPD